MKRRRGEDPEDFYDRIHDAWKAGDVDRAGYRIETPEEIDEARAAARAAAKAHEAELRELRGNHRDGTVPSEPDLIGG